MSWIAQLVRALAQKAKVPVFEKIFGAKKDEITGEWRKIRNIELHALYSSRNVIRNLKSRRLR